jgi:type VII secretion protein EccB
VRSRQDQLHAYQHATQRVVAALVSHDPDVVRSPFNRTFVTAAVGGLLAVIALAGALLWGQFHDASSVRDLRDESAVFVEAETGARYVYLKSDDKLHPVLNYASGRLVAGTAQSPAATVTIHRANRTRLQRDQKVDLGATLGIAGAPDSLPAARELATGPWQVCTSRDADGTGAPRRTLLVDATAPGGRPLGGDGLYVADPLGNHFLVYGNHRFLMRHQDAVLAAFGWSNLTPVAVDSDWINAVPAGPDLKPLHVGDVGAAGVHGYRIGRLLDAPGPGDTRQWKVVRKADVLAISDTQARLLAADPQTHMGEPIELSTADFGTLPTAPPGAAGAGEQALLPPTPPRIAAVARTTCVTVPDAATGVGAIVLDPALPDTGAAPGPRVSVPVGGGTLVEVAAAPGAPPGSGTVSIVTAGRRYAVADRDALARLGYGGVTPQRMPGELITLVPPGPALGAAEALSARG